MKNKKAAHNTSHGRKIILPTFLFYKCWFVLYNHLIISYLHLVFSYCFVILLADNQ